MIVNDREAADRAAKQQDDPQPLPVGEQIAVLAVATVISAVALFALQPELNGFLVGVMIILAVIVVSQGDK